MINFNSKDFVKETMEDCSVIVNVHSNEVFLLNSTSEWIFKRLIEQQEIEYIVDEYIGKLEDADYDVVYQDFIGVKNELIEQGILYEH